MLDPKDIITPEIRESKMAQIQENRERRKQGLPYLKFETAEQQQKLEQEPKEEETTTRVSTSSATPKENTYAYMQSQIQANLAYFQAEKIGVIAQNARKDKFIVYEFPSNPEPPKMGVKPTPQSRKYIAHTVYYNELENDIHEKLQDMRSEVKDLQNMKALGTPSVSPDGVMIPAELTKNDPEITHIDNKTWATINQTMNRLNRDIAEKMALYYYGIPKELIPKLETNSLSTALEAGLYRELYGIVNSSKNSGIS